MTTLLQVDVLVLARAANAIRDALYEIEQPEINELVTGALERKLERSLLELEEATK